MATLLDSYSEANRTEDYAINHSVKACGQSFTCTPAITLDSAKFFLKRINSPTGNCYAKLYSHSGTYGTNSVPNILLATSDAIDVTTISDSAQSLVTFNFSGAERVALSPSTYYVVVFDYAGGTVSNKINVGRGNIVTHGGNDCYYSGDSWYAASNDVCFYVYGAVTASSNSPSILLNYYH
jgi:hypothetical protein